MILNICEVKEVLLGCPYIMEKALSKEELKRPDSFIQFFQKLVRYSQANLRKILMGTIVLVAMVIGYLVNSAQTKQMDLKASDEYAQIVGSLSLRFSEASQADWKTFDQQIESFLVTYPKSSMAPMILLYQGRANLYLKEYSKALTVYQNASKKLPKPYNILAQEGVAISHQFVGDWESSQKVFQELTLVQDNPFLDYHLWNLGLVQEELGLTEQAISTYGILEKDHLGSSYLPKAKAKKSILENI